MVYGMRSSIRGPKNQFQERECEGLCILLRLLPSDGQNQGFWQGVTLQIAPFQTGFQMCNE